jgi:hypothetical protein
MARPPGRLATVRIVLTSHDDFPLHQSSLPMAYSATADLNHYDRYFFNGYTADGELYFGAAMGLYPNRHVVDAAFSALRDDQQVSVFASGRAPMDRARATVVGPIEVIVQRPLRELRLLVDAPDNGLRADLLFTARSEAIEEPHFLLRVGTRPMMDYTRLTQFGEWSGWVEVDGQRHEMAVAWGSRDRSWGVRPVGEPAPSGAPVTAPQFFWLWAPVNFPSLSTHFDTNDLADGTPWHQVGALARVGGVPEMMRSVDYRVTWRPGTRWADRCEYDLVDCGGGIHTVALEPFREFQMSGIGYGHPTFGHGTWHGESMVAGERIAVPVDDPCAPGNIHIQALSRARYTAPDGRTERGLGILEQLAIGPHPTGLTGILDPHAP